MGNFSRNTFDSSKSYVGVRLQQGVPLVDADWNELEDVRRQELYQSLAAGFSGPGVAQTSSAGVVDGSKLTNDFVVLPGWVLVQQIPAVDASTMPPGPRPAFVAGIRYSQQTDSGAPIAPLTTPTDHRTDLVYLDVVEREVGHEQDPSIVNQAIGVETCVRIKREGIVRVLEGTPGPKPVAPALPNPTAGHAFLPLALLHRKKALSNIQTATPGDSDFLLLDPKDPWSFVPRIEDVRPRTVSPSFPFLDWAEVVDPPPASASSGQARMYVRSNGTASPNHRSQLVMKWSDGSVTVIAESPPS